MPQIKHIAIATNDAEKTAKFFSEVFGLRQVAELNGENAKGFMLSDGNVNMAILDFQSDAVAGERGKGLGRHPPHRLRGRELGGDRGPAGCGPLRPDGRGQRRPPRRKHRSPATRT